MLSSRGLRVAFGGVLVGVIGCSGGAGMPAGAGSVASAAGPSSSSGAVGTTGSGGAASSSGVGGAGDGGGSGSSSAGSGVIVTGVGTDGGTSTLDCTSLPAASPGARVWQTCVPVPTAAATWSFAVGPTGHAFVEHWYSAAALDELDIQGSPVPGPPLQYSDLSVDFLVFGGSRYVTNETGGSFVESEGVTWTNETGLYLQGFGDAAGDIFLSLTGTSPSTTAPFLQRIDPTGASVYKVALPAFTAFAPYALQSIGDGAGAAYLWGSGPFTGDFGCGPISATSSQEWIVKMGPSGQCVWSRALPVPFDGIVPSGAEVYLTGGLDGSADLGCGPMGAGTGTSEYVALLDPGGACLWSKAFASSPPALAVLPSGDALLHATGAGMVDVGCGPVAGPAAANTYLARIDPSGACVWSKTVAASLDVQTWPSGDVLLDGSVSGPVDLGGGPLPAVGDQDLVLARLDGASGAPVWANRYGGAGLTVDAVATPDGIGGTHVRAEWSPTSGSTGGSIDFGGGPLSSPGSTHLRVDDSGAFRWQGVPDFLYEAPDPCGGLIGVASIAEHTPCPGLPVFVNRVVVARIAP